MRKVYGASMGGHFEFIVNEHKGLFYGNIIRGGSKPVRLFRTDDIKVCRAYIDGYFKGWEDKSL